MYVIMHPKKSYQSLLNKYLLNECTAVEAEQLFNYLKEDGATRALLENLKISFDEEIEKPRSILPQVSDDVWGRLQVNIQTSQPEKTYTLKRWISVAAAVIILFSAGLIFINNQPRQHRLASRKERYKNDIAPGANKAVLTLANGSAIVLDQTIQNGVVTKQGQTIISKVSNGLLTYKAPATNDATIHYNTISTPKGGEYRVVLPDGTQVWLNAASSLKFPTAFVGKKRVVELIGEAYFEVAKNKKMPFSVSTKGVTVEVLGTHFNVNAYNDEATIKTTLLEGSVKLYSGAGQIMLVPGQQSSFNKQARTTAVLKVDTEEAVAWKNGNFTFASEDIQSSLRKVSRWYDVDIDYQQNIPKKAIWGTVSRFGNVSEVLKMIELTGVAHFEISGRRIIVMK
jgi:transmembrane sensor